MGEMNIDLQFTHTVLDNWEQFDHRSCFYIDPVKMDAFVTLARNIHPKPEEMGWLGEWKLSEFDNRFICADLREMESLADDLAIALPAIVVGPACEREHHYRTICESDKCCCK